MLGVILLFSDLQNNLQLLEEDQFALTLEASGIEDKHAILIESKWQLLFVCLFVLVIKGRMSRETRGLLRMFFEESRTDSERRGGGGLFSRANVLPLALDITLRK